MSLSDELNRLAELRHSGTLTEDEFARAKARLLNGQAPHMTYSSNTFRRSRRDR